jgi:hypothetical protein
MTPGCHRGRRPQRAWFLTFTLLKFRWHPFENASVPRKAACAHFHIEILLVAMARGTPRPEHLGSVWLRSFSRGRGSNAWTEITHAQNPRCAAAVPVHGSFMWLGTKD